MGETVDVNVADLLSVLARRRLSGRLGITADGDEVHLYLTDGRLVSVSSSNHGLRLGRTLIRLGILQPVHLEVAIQEQEVTGHGRPLGEILLDHGWISRDGLAQGAEEQCIEALARVIVAEQGSFMFSREATPRAQIGLVALNTDSIILEAARRADEMVMLRSLLPPPGARLRLTRAAPETTTDLSIAETRVVERLRERPATLPDLAQQIATEEVALWRAVVGLRERGWIAILGVKTDAEPEEAHEPDHVADRTADEIVSLGASAGVGDPPRPMPTLPEIRAGTPASAQTVAAVTLVTREVIAAFNAGMPLRAFAHFSDDHFRRQGPLAEEEVAILRGPSIPLAPEEQETIVAVRDVRRLADGRISAILVSHYAGLGETRKVLVFARAGDHWQIDAVVETPLQPTGLLTAPAPNGHEPDDGS